jgi:hypothetical protein
MKPDGEQVEQKKIEEPPAHPQDSRRAKELIQELYKEYEKYLRPLEEVRALLAKDLEGKEPLSKTVVRLRRRERR